MLAYILLLAIVILLGVVFYSKNSTLNKKWYFYIVSFISICIIGMRNIEIGPDTGQYNNYFILAANNNLSNNFSGGWEKGFLLLQFIVSRFSSHSYVFFTIVALFFVSSVSFFIYRNSSNPVLSYILFITMGFFVFSLTGMRQVVAFSIILFSFEFIKKRKLFLFILLVVIASLFHTSALIFLIAYFISRKKFTSFYILSIFTIVGIMYVFQTQIFKIITQFTKYDNYGKLENSGAINLTILLIIITLGVIIQKKQLLKLNKENIILMNMLVLTLVFLPLANVHPSALRIAYYFYFYEILLIPELIKSVKDKGLRGILYFIGIIVVLFLFFTALQGTTYIPYRFFWQ